MSLDAVLGWVAIGTAAALAGMIWPFRRGAVGIVINLLTGIAGALVAVLLSYLVLPPSGGRSGPARLLVAALGALSGLGVVHSVWMHRVVHRAESR
jgi:uncharacterized membrane protein YeaQ/YmgE (transglycosylase-associated protein family)